MYPQLVTDLAIIGSIQELRADVWRAKGLSSCNFPDGRILDNHDVFATHWAVFDDKSVIAAARLSIHVAIEESPYPHYFARPSWIHEKIVFPLASMDRLVVAKDARGQGLARELDSVRISYAKNAGCKTIVLVVHELSGQGRLDALRDLGFAPLYPEPISDIEWGGLCTPVYLSL